MSDDANRGMRTRCRSWLLEVAPVEASGAAVARLHRPADGTVIELEDLDVDALRTLWSSLAAPIRGSDLEAVFAPLADLLPLFLEEGIVRVCTPPRAVAIAGDGPLRPLGDALLAAVAWDLPPLCFRAELDRAPPSTTDGVEDGVVVGMVGDGIVAAHSAGCVSCLRWRVLGAMGRPGEEQLDVPAVPICSPPEQRSALLAAALVELERGALGAFEAVWARPDVGVGRGRYLAHPDCACRAARPSNLGPAWLRGELAHLGEPTTQARIRARFGDSPFAPLAIHTATAAAGAFPFDGPYISGDTRLSRGTGGRIFCVSMPGIVHGSASTPEHSLLLAWSEGVERLAAQSATPDLVLAPGDARVAAACRRHGWRAPRAEAAFRLGLDLLDQGECLVPFERIAVGLPAPLCPGGAVVEPTFTGVASHFSHLEAILHGTVELLKRDAFMLAWYRKRPLARVELPARLPSDVAARLEYLDRHGLVVEVRDLRADVSLPMVLTVVRASRRVGCWPAGGALVVPAGGFTAVDALRHALTLACSRFVGIGLDDVPEHDPLDAEAVATLGLRAPFWPPLARYLDPARSGALSFLRGDVVVPLASLEGDVPDDPDALCRFRALEVSLRAAKMSWIAVPLSDPDVVAAGLRVVRVVVPEAARMTLRHEEVDRDQARFRLDFPGMSPGSWNEDPHPVY